MAVTTTPQVIPPPPPRLSNGADNLGNVMTANNNNSSTEITDLRLISPVKDQRASTPTHTPPSLLLLVNTLLLKTQLQTFNAKTTHRFPTRIAPPRVSLGARGGTIWSSQGNELPADANRSRYATLPEQHASYLLLPPCQMGPDLPGRVTPVDTGGLPELSLVAWLFAACGEEGNVLIIPSVGIASRPA